MKKLSAGNLTESVAVELLDEGSDGGGGVTSNWSEQFQARARYIHLRGGESVRAARLSGNHIQVVRMRASINTRSVTTDHRIRDLRSGDVFNIRDIEPSEDRLHIDFLCEKGVAVNG